MRSSSPNQFGDPGNAFAFFAGNLEQGGIFAGDFRDRGVAQEANHLAGEVGGAVAFANEVVDLAEDFFAAAFGNRLHHLFEDVGGSGADQVADRVGGDASAGGGDGLVEDGESVAHGAVAGFGEQGESVIIGFDFFAGDEVAQLGDDGVKFDGAKTKMLAARADCLRNVLRLRGGEHEDDVVGGLFERFEERVEGSVGDLVRFVKNVDFEAIASRAIAGGLAEFADFVDAAVRGGVDLDYIDGVAGSDFCAGLADAAGFGDRAILGAAVKGHSQNASYGRFANAAVAAEDVAVGGASLLDRVLEGTGDVLLSDDLGELLRTIFAGQDRVTHGRKSRLYVMRGRS